MEAIFGTIDSPTSASTDSTISGLNSPKALIIWATNATSEAYWHSAAFSLGFATNYSSTIEQACHGWKDEDDADDADEVANGSNCVYVLDPADGSDLLVGAVSSWGSSSITIDWSVVGSSQYKIHYCVLQGDGIDNARCGLHDADPASPVEIDSGFSNSADGKGFYLFSGSTQTGGRGERGWGWAVSSTDQHAICGRNRPSNNGFGWKSSSSRCVMQADDDTTPDFELSFDAHSTNSGAGTGFQLSLDVDSAGDVMKFAWLHVDGPDAKSQDVSAGTNSNDLTISGESYEPILAILSAVAGWDAYTEQTAGGMDFCFGAGTQLQATVTAVRGFATGNLKSNSDADGTGDLYSDSVIEGFATQGDALPSAAVFAWDISSFESDGAVFSQAVHGNDDQLVRVLLVGPPDTGGGGTPVSNSIECSVESLQGVAATPDASVESLQGISASVAQAVESLQGIDLSTGASVESLQSVSPEQVAAVESLQGIDPDQEASVESLQGLAPDAETAVESLQGIASTQEASVESLQGLGSDAEAAVESLQGVEQDREVAVESKGPLAVSSSVVCAVESLQGLSPDQGTSVESLQGIEAIQVSSVESIESVDASVVSSLESLQGIEVSVEVAVESRGGVAVSNSVSCSVESLQGLQPDRVVSVESVKDISASVAVAVESITSVEAESQASVESLQGVSSAIEVAVESGGAAVIPPTAFTRSVKTTFTRSVKTTFTRNVRTGWSVPPRTDT